MRFFLVILLVVFEGILLQLVIGGSDGLGVEFASESGDLDAIVAAKCGGQCSTEGMTKCLAGIAPGPGVTVCHEDGGERLGKCKNPGSVCTYNYGPKDEFCADGEYSTVLCRRTPTSCATLSKACVTFKTEEYIGEINGIPHYLVTYDCDCSSDTITPFEHGNWLDCNTATNESECPPPTL